MLPLFESRLFAAFAMDLLTRIHIGSLLAILVLPALAVFCLPKSKLSVLMGGLIFWGWLVLLSDFMRECDPSSDSPAALFNFLLGLPFGIGYCAIWAAIRRRLQRAEVRRSRGILSLVVWSGVIGLCAFVPFIVVHVNNRSLSFYAPYLLLGEGPILLLSVTMVISSVADIRTHNKRVLPRESKELE
jgi:hypothetical protein